MYMKKLQNIQDSFRNTLSQTHSLKIRVLRDNQEALQALEIFN